MRKISCVSLRHYISENTDLCALSQEPLLYSKMRLVKTYQIGWHHKLFKRRIFLYWYIQLHVVSSYCWKLDKMNPRQCSYTRIYLEYNIHTFFQSPQLQWFNIDSREYTDFTSKKISMNFKFGRGVSTNQGRGDIRRLRENEDRS